jgi:hypothetical protein
MDQWFVLEMGKSMVCPFTYQKVPSPVPIIDFFKPDDTSYKHEGIQLTIWDQLQLFDYHRFSSVNAADPKSNKTPRGVFIFSDRKWWFQNQSGEVMKEVNASTGQIIEHPSGGQPIRVYSNMQLILSDKPEGRLALIRFYNG